MTSSTPQVDPSLAHIHLRLSTELPYFAQNVLKVRTKIGLIKPFVMNRAQQYLHDRLEKQKRETGMVRAIILKGRQQGCSTYVAARFYSYTVWNHARSVFILSHHSQTTKALFAMAERYHTLSSPQLRPKIKVNNQKELKFENMSQYSVGTAGSGSIGRGETVQYFHGSEVAFYENTDDIDTGALQTVADEPGTEIILESTANGRGNYFYNKCMSAINDPDSRYELIFIPWFWQEEYRSTPPDSFVASEDEKKLAALYNLDESQLYWRRRKIADFKNSGENGEWKFKQEYPCNVDEAFQTSGESLVSNIAIEEARKAKVTDAHAATVIGVDPARDGDRTAIVIRKGRQLIERIVYSNMDEMRLAHIITQLIERYSAKKVFIDVAHGHGTADRLHELGYRKEVTTVHFGERALEDHLYINKRSEMAASVRDWFEQGGVSIPNYEDLVTDIMAIPTLKQNTQSKWQLEKKENIKKIYGKSPDIFDALMLTFAYPVNPAMIESGRIRKSSDISKKHSPLRTQRGFRTAPQQKRIPGYNQWD